MDIKEHLEVSALRPLGCSKMEIRADLAVIVG